MPDRAQEQSWANEIAGIRGCGDVSIPKLEKAEAIKRYHRFFLHESENRTEKGLKLKFKQMVDGVLSEAETQEISRFHNCLNKHNY